MSESVVRADRAVVTVAAVVAAAALALLGCDGTPSPKGAPATQDAGGDGASAPDAYVAVLPCEPTLASIQASIFEVTCQFEYCHGASAASGLWLLDPHVERELVGVRSAGCPGWTLVTPGSPERSLLWQKITSDHPPCRGNRMPYGLGRLPPQAIECVRGWIESLGTDGASGASDGRPP